MAAPAAPAGRSAPEADPANAQRTAEALDAHYDQRAADARQTQLALALDEGAYRMASSLAPDDPAVQATCASAIRLAAWAR